MRLPLTRGLNLLASMRLAESAAKIGRRNFAGAFPAKVGKRSWCESTLEDAIFQTETEAMGRERTALKAAPVLVFVIDCAPYEMMVQINIQTAAGRDHEISAVREIKREVELAIA
jgi:hypothetical protein